jgi:hypothetical protein
MQQRALGPFGTGERQRSERLIDRCGRGARSRHRICESRFSLREPWQFGALGSGCTTRARGPCDLEATVALTLQSDVIGGAEAQRNCERDGGRRDARDQ